MQDFFATMEKPNLKTTMAILEQYEEIYPLLRQYKAKKRAMAIFEIIVCQPRIFFTTMKEEQIET